MSTKTATPQKLRIDGPRETFHAQSDARFDNVAHVFHLEWHGIRSATSCLPGHKIGITADHTIDGDMIRRVMGFIYRENVTTLIYQAFSSNADILARAIASTFRSRVRQFIITHTTSTQFEYRFEIDQQRAILLALSDGIFARIGSVKPHFSSVIPQYWPKTIYNAPPSLTTYRASTRKSYATVFIPLENTLRKNLYTNVLAALNSPSAGSIWSVNNPSGLEGIVNSAKCKVIGYQRGSQLYDRMWEAAAVLNCTLAECQPMTQLEALAVGTPCLTGPLNLEELADHPITRLLEVPVVDTPFTITAALEAVLAHVQNDSDAFARQLKEYLDLRTSLSLNSLINFADL